MICKVCNHVMNVKEYKDNTAYKCTNCWNSYKAKKPKKIIQIYKDNELCWALNEYELKNKTLKELLNAFPKNKGFTLRYA